MNPMVCYKRRFDSAIAETFSQESVHAIVAPVLEVVEAGVVGRLKDHVHPAEPRTVHPLTPILLTFTLEIKCYVIICKSILPLLKSVCQGQR